ncbi:MAG TPA: nucleoside triphosphate pyrophosphohydrolase [Alphaproteobacteria bacterium]|nr:nucleoside triphosphate pyrophosphohydrolase [Alphaproteobacteria bacterium]
MARSNIDRLLEIMARLRDPERGCPWDMAQSFATIAPYTIEEAYEVADAIARQDLDALREELGDLLLQVVFHARMAEEARSFDFEAVAGAIADKMIRRHPHVFGEEEIKDAETQRQAWEAHKENERAAAAAARGQGGESALEGVALSLPALTRALKLQRRAARVGFDWTETASVLAKVEEEIRELSAELVEGSPPERVEDELGDLLFSLVNLARRLELDPEAALRQSNAKFERRFRRVEAFLAEAGKVPKEATLDEMDALWERAKREEGKK